MCLRLSATDVPLQEIKCNRLGLPQKQMILNRIALRADHEIFYVTAQKKYVSLLQQAKDKNLTYNYLAGILVLEIVKKYNDDIAIHFDQHSVKVASMNSLPDYLKIKAYTKGNFQHSMQVGQFDSRTMYNLQTADMIAGIVNAAYITQSKHLLSIIESRLEAKIQFPNNLFDRKLF